MNGILHKGQQSEKLRVLPQHVCGKGEVERETKIDFQTETLQKFCSAESFVLCIPSRGVGADRESQFVEKCILLRISGSEDRGLEEYVQLALKPSGFNDAVAATCVACSPRRVPVKRFHYERFYQTAFSHENVSPQ